MLASVIIFCSCVLILAIIVVWLLRPVLKGISNYAKTHAEIYGGAYVKASCLILLAMGTTFKETWQPVTSAQAAGWAPWDWIIHILAPMLSGLSVLAAFLDRSMERADKTKTTNTTPPFPTSQQ